jgi:hypothetical protein
VTDNNNKLSIDQEEASISHQYIGFNPNELMTPPAKSSILRGESAPIVHSTSLTLTIPSSSNNQVVTAGYASLGK